MITIEKPTEEDAKSIQQVFYETWLATYPNKKIGITSEDIEEKYKDRFSKQSIKKLIERILDKSENNFFLISRQEGKIIGVCRIKKEESFNEILAIYILPSHQKKGIGKMFLDRAMEFFGGDNDIIVHVATYNVKAINFYKKMGFIDTGKRFADKKFKMPISGSYIPEMEMIIKRKKKS